MAERLELVESLSGLRYSIDGRPLVSGDVIAVCFSGGWVIGRFEWNRDVLQRPRFHATIELGDGDVESVEFEIPERALVRREAPGAIL